MAHPVVPDSDEGPVPSPGEIQSWAGTATVIGMDGRRMMRRVVVSALLVSLVLSLTAWREAPSTIERTDGRVTVPSAPALVPEAPLRTRAEVLTSGTIEHRPVKSRPRLGLAVLVGLSALLVIVMVGLHRLWPGQSLKLWWRASVTLRAPPVLRLA